MTSAPRSSKNIEPYPIHHVSLIDTAILIFLTVTLICSIEIALNVFKKNPVGQWPWGNLIIICNLILFLTILFLSFSS